MRYRASFLASAFGFLYRLIQRAVRIAWVRTMINLAKLKSCKQALLTLIIASIIISAFTSLFLTNFWGQPVHKRRSREGPFTGYRDCRPETKIAFLKTHKCASSSVQNLLLRYAHKQELTVALPAAGNYVGRYRPFHRSALWGTSWDMAHLPYDLFCLHTIWDAQEVAALFGDGGEEPVYFSILRDPVDLFISLWDYAKLETYFHVDLEAYALANKTDPRFRDRSKITNLGRNQMLWDFGLPAKLFEDEQAVKDKIKEIDARFDLIMIAERFDESMVLLRDLLCWTYEDMTSLKLNAVKKEKKSHLSLEAYEALKKWLSADYALYDHFTAKLQSSIVKHGESRLQQEMRIFRSANSRVQERCVLKEVDNKLLEGKFHTWSNDVVGYQLKDESDEFCALYGLSEMAFLDQLREEQGARAEAVLQSRGETFTARIEEENAHKARIPIMDPSKLRPLDMLTAGGKPDIEKLKKAFAHA